MALKPTIYKFQLSLSNFDENYFDNLDLTLALHPSETPERMLARLMAFCLNAQEGLTFTKGLSTVEEPDIWLKNLQGDITLWIEVGEPKPERIKKACRLAKLVKVYSFNSKSATWWSQEAKHFKGLKADILALPWEPLKSLVTKLERTNELALSIDAGSISASLNEQNAELQPINLSAQQS
jgi:uncharacterized protein YaeQ